VLTLSAFCIHACKISSSDAVFQKKVSPLNSCPMRLWIIYWALSFAPSTALRKDYGTTPVCCMDADGLFMGDATLRKIFCLQETLRGVWGRTPLNESLLQPDRVLFLPSPLLQKKIPSQRHPIKESVVKLHRHPLSILLNVSTNIPLHTYTRQIQQNPLDWWQMVKMS